MPQTTPARALPDGLAEVLERQIEQRTCRRVRLLRVDGAQGRLVVQGVTSSYYVKQLALAAVHEVVAPGQAEVDIRVG